MEAEGVIKVGHEIEGDLADQAADSLNGDRPDLLGLGLGVAFEAGVGGDEQHLEGVDPVGIGGNGDHGDHSMSQSGGGGIGAIVADNHRGPGLGGLSAQSRAEVDDADLSSTHQRYASPSEAAESQRWLSSLSHCVNASA